MSTIKNSFKKILFPMVVITAVVMLIGIAFSYIEKGLVNLNVRGFIGFEYPSSMPNPAHYTFIDEIIQLIYWLIICPFTVGGFRYCLKKLDGLNCNIKEVFCFFSKPKYIIGAFIVKILPSVAGNLVSSLFRFSINVYKYMDRRLLMLISLIICVLFLALDIFLWLSTYIYSVRNYESAFKAVSRSFSAAKRSFIKIFVIILICTILNSAYYIVLLILDEPTLETAFLFNSVFNIAVQFVLSAIINFAFIVLAYTILKKEQLLDFNMFLNNSVVPEKTDIELTDDTPFIEPYDFYIEADERFNDEKIIETEDIRGVDILAVLDEMELADDVKIDLAIRRKLKKMFEELSFEIGEYVTYEGGREIENDFTEEIDEREFEISVEITRNSDYEPFKLILRVNVSDNEE